MRNKQSLVVVTEGENFSGGPRGIEEGCTGETLVLQKGRSKPGKEVREVELWFSSRGRLGPLEKKTLEKGRTGGNERGKTKKQKALGSFPQEHSEGKEEEERPRGGILGTRGDRASHGDIDLGSKPNGSRVNKVKGIWDNPPRGVKTGREIHLKNGD